ncbi:MAG: lysoplasmalogenase family protein [Jatrophihabitantaceae bacterium]
MTLAFLVVAGVAGVTDWFAVGRGLRGLEYAAKPLTLALLIAAACFADLGVTKTWVLAALVLGLLGDIALLVGDRNPSTDQGRAQAFFLIGLGSFLLGHIAYVVAFARHGLHPVQLLAGGLVVVGAAGLALPRVLRGARQQGGRLLAALVGGYSALLGAMTVLGFGTSAVLTAIGTLLFLASDLTLAWGRYVQATRHGPVIVAVTYHAAQALIVIGLIR